MTRAVSSWTAWSWARCGALALSCFACAKIVGITDTEVTRSGDEMATGANLSQGGGAGASSVESAGSGGMSGALGGESGQSGISGAGAQPSAAGAGGGMPMELSGDAGTVAPACTEAAARCGAEGREVCVSGAWQAQPCPPEAPTCEGEGQCIVRGPALISVGGAFFIDSTEVTNAQYRQFVMAKGDDVSGQIPACSWNTAYYEEIAYGPDNEPVVMVDWCDAYAFCAWADKRLCGRIGGGPIPIAELEEQTLNQWYLACGGPAGRLYPNDDRDCNTSSGFESVAPVASFPGCEGFYPGIFDMLGNVWEWIDDCNASQGPDDICAPMGGSTIQNETVYCYYYGETEGEDAWRRTDKNRYTGFRCCAG